MNIILSLSMVGIFSCGTLNENMSRPNEMLEKNGYKEIAYAFIDSYYKEKGIDNRHLLFVSEIDLFNYYNVVNGKAIIFENNGLFSYVVFNLLNNNIDEFAFDSYSFPTKFKEKTYYSGCFDYYSLSNGKFVNKENKMSLTNSQFKTINDERERKLKNNKQSDSDFGGNPNIPSSRNGYNGFYSFSKISTLGGYYRYDNNYLWGFGPEWQTSSITFTSQTVYNGSTYDNSCGAVACTNMFLWYQKKNIKNKNGVVNCLKNNNTFDTFERFITLTEHSNTTGINNSKINDALIKYAKEQEYNYEIDRYVDTFEEFKENIDAQMPILTYAKIGDWYGHFVVVVGYESFCQEYKESHSFLWHNWTTTEYRYANYLRVIDGWNTSNDCRYIDASGYWDKLEGRGFTIYG